MRNELSKTRQNGFVVVVVLSMVSVLAVLLLGFNYMSRKSLIAVEDFQKSQQAINCARAGLNIAIAAIRSSEDVCTDKKLAELLSEKTFFSVGDGSCSVTIIDESSKLNVNLLKDKDGKMNLARVSQLLRIIDVLNRPAFIEKDLPRIGYGIVPAIIDWIDTDDEVTYLSFIQQENLGAESDSYLDRNYPCKNNLLETTDELLPVKGVTPEVFERIYNYVTVKGDGKININSASKAVIESLSEKMDAAVAQVIVERRKVKPFGSVMELRDVSGMTDDIYYSIKDMVTISPQDPYYLVRSSGRVGQVDCTIVALLRKNTQDKMVDVILYKELKLVRRG